MLVKDLITFLKTMPPDAVVVYWTGSEEYDVANSVEVQLKQERYIYSTDNILKTYPRDTVTISLEG